MQPLHESDFGAWDSFIAEQKNGTIFHTAWWHKAWGADLQVYAKKDKNGEIEAGMPMHISRFPSFMRSLGVRGIRRPPLTPVNGPVFKECVKTSRSSIYTHVKRELLNAIMSMPSLDFYDIGLEQSNDDLMPFLWNGFDTHVGYTYVIPASEIDVWKQNMSDKTRRALKGAHKEALENGCTIEADPPFKEIGHLFQETEKFKGFSMEKHAGRLPGWWAEVKRMGAGRTYALRDGSGKPICSSLIVWDNRRAYCLVNGMLRKMRKQSHLNMLLFERMITDVLAMGLDFDFNGSVLLGVERFFRGWGGELRHNYRVTKIPSAFAYISWKSYSYLKSHRKYWVVPT